MICSECGEKISFIGRVCPFCLSDKSDDKALQIKASVSMAVGAAIGYWINGFLGSMIGLLAGGVVGTVFHFRNNGSAIPKLTKGNSDSPESFRSPSPVAVPVTANDRVKAKMAVIQRGAATYETYEEVLALLGGSITSKGFFIGMHYMITLGGTTSRVNKFEDLRPWFLDNVAPRLSA